MLNWDVQDVRRYKDKPFEFEEKLDLTKELKSRSEDVLEATPVEIKGQLFNDNGLVISDVKVKTTLKVPSTRSLLPVEFPVDIRINEAYNVENVEAEDLEDYNIVIPIDDDNPTINIYESVIDNILLSIPSKILTKKEEQDNIMPSGKNWEVISEEDFKKQKEEEHVNPEFAKLKNLFKDNSDKE
ncbi:YceD family protein [Companilactobacillus musae]|uniref:YceD family protein n=1 Tax=Companilactobacillus musae TaxID=1903258 RepID=UPI000E6482D7|nr:YceD family protein [Companilactobacillus musae]